MKTDKLPLHPWAKVPDEGNPGDTRITAQNRCIVKVYGSDASDSEGTGAALADFIIDSAIASESIAVFNESSVRERALWAAREDALLDCRLASRDGNEEALTEAKAREATTTSEWSEVYSSMKPLFADVLGRVGLDVEAVGRVARSL